MIPCCVEFKCPKLDFEFVLGPFIYYVSTGGGEGGGQKMPVSAYS